MRGHIMINAITVGPEVEFYGVDTPCGEMFEISVNVEKKVSAFQHVARITFLAQDVILGIKGGFGAIDWHTYDGQEVIDLINEIPIDSEIDHYIKAPIVIRLDNVVSEIN